MAAGSAAGKENVRVDGGGGLKGKESGKVGGMGLGVRESR